MSNVFQIVKSKVRIEDAASEYLGLSLVPCGTGLLEPDDKTCPFCAHRDCLRFNVKDPEEESFICYSCHESGDVISLVKKACSLEHNMEAVSKINQDYKLGLDLSRKDNLTLIEKIFKEASEYYRAKLFESTFSICHKDGLTYTPLSYQTKIRGHQEDALSALRVGFSDGGLTEFMMSVGYSAEDMLKSGLSKRDEETGDLYDFFQQGLFIYPHFTPYRVSRFTQKDPDKRVAYQLPAKYWLNECIFYGQESVLDVDKVIIVEGQNDRISLVEAGFKGGILATCGAISQKQLDWISSNLKGKTIMSAFDNDTAGNNYRKKLDTVIQCSHIVFPEDLLDKEGNPCKDIDQFLKKVNPNLTSAFSYVKRKVDPSENKVLEAEPPKSKVPTEEKASVSVPQYDKESQMVVKDGCYYKVKFTKDDGEVLQRISNFTIKLRNIYILDGKRVREAEVRRNDSSSIAKIMVNSETKTSLKHFRTVVADACDADFSGSESDLRDMWSYIYRNNTERTVFLPDHIGNIEDEGGWLFGNCYIKSNGDVVKADEHGVMWVNGNIKGIKPCSISDDLDIDVHSKNIRNIPRIKHGLMEEEVARIQHDFVINYAKNLGNQGMALLIIGWAKLNAFSNKMFRTFGFTPFLFLWGDKGVGKTSLIHWILELYSMKKAGYETLANLRSGVGFERKLGYYSSLPVSLDELRASRELAEFTGRFRAWYNRSGRSMAGQGSKKIIQQVVRSNFIFGGQDMFTDDALRERTIVIRIPKTGREMKESYRVLHELESSGVLSSIGLHWIQESLSCNYEEIYENVDNISAELLSIGCSQRTSLVWACIAHFSEQISKEYFPEFDFRGFLKKVCVEDVNTQKSNNFLFKFWELYQGIYFQDRSPITMEHIDLKAGELRLVWPETHRICSSERSRVDEYFTREAIKNALMEEDYFIKESVVRIGRGVGSSKRAIILNATHPNLPEPLVSIIEHLGAQPRGQEES